MTQIAQNANRLLKTLLEHNKERNDILRLAAALDYDDPAQLETDIEDFITAALRVYYVNQQKRASS